MLREHMKGRSSHMRPQFIISHTVVLYREVICRAIVLSLTCPPLYYAVGAVVRVYLRCQKKRT
jgi:hypothetical protein